MTDLIVLEAAEMKRMLRNEQIVAEFPFMRNAAEKEKARAKKKGCNCGGSKKVPNEADYSGIRAAIAGMSNEKKQRLKDLLGTQQLRLYYFNVKRQKVKLTF